MSWLHRSALAAKLCLAAQRLAHSAAQCHSARQAPMPACHAAVPWPAAYHCRSARLHSSWQALNRPCSTAQAGLPTASLHKHATAGTAALFPSPVPQVCGNLAGPQSAAGGLRAARKHSAAADSAQRTTNRQHAKRRRAAERTRAAAAQSEEIAAPSAVGSPVQPATPPAGASDAKLMNVAQHQGKATADASQPPVQQADKRERRRQRENRKAAPLTQHRAAPPSPLRKIDASIAQASTSSHATDKAAQGAASPAQTYAKPAHTARTSAAHESSVRPLQATLSAWLTRASTALASGVQLLRQRCVSASAQALDVLHYSLFPWAVRHTRSALARHGQHHCGSLLSKEELHLLANLMPPGEAVGPWWSDVPPADAMWRRHWMTAARGAAGDFTRGVALLQAAAKSSTKAAGYRDVLLLLLSSMGRQDLGKMSPWLSIQVGRSTNCFGLCSLLPLMVNALTSQLGITPYVGRWRLALACILCMKIAFPDNLALAYTAAALPVLPCDLAIATVTHHAGAASCQQAAA